MHFWRGQVAYLAAEDELEMHDLKSLNVFKDLGVGLSPELFYSYFPKKRVLIYAYKVNRTSSTFAMLTLLSSTNQSGLFSAIARSDGPKAMCSLLK